MIEYHADDYGLFPRQSERILDCIDHGKINGISIMPNSPFLDECMQLLGERPVALTIHLNFVEGRALSCQGNLLTDESGNFNISFGKLLLISYIPALRAKYQKEIEKEISLQIRACEPYFRGKPLRLDGHCHYQMLPVVFDAMMNVIVREQLNVSYIRIPYEKMAVYEPHRAELEYTKAINSVKVLLLNFLTKRAERCYPDWFGKNPRVPFAGVFLSGSMTKHNAERILAQMTAEAEASEAGWGEMLFHPGAVLEPENIAALTSEDDVSFLTSPMRAKEAEAVKSMI